MPSHRDGRQGCGLSRSRAEIESDREPARPPSWQISRPRARPGSPRTRLRNHGRPEPTLAHRVERADDSPETGGQRDRQDCPGQALWRQGRESIERVTGRGVADGATCRPSRTSGGDPSSRRSIRSRATSVRSQSPPALPSPSPPEVLLIGAVESCDEPRSATRRLRSATLRVRTASCPRPPIGPKSTRNVVAHSPTPGDLHRQRRHGVVSRSTADHEKPT